jgi:hypothetical protein
MMQDITLRQSDIFTHRQGLTSSKRDFKEADILTASSKVRTLLQGLMSSMHSQISAMLSARSQRMFQASTAARLDL